jgi:FMN-dependent NADH-azoreductase
MQLYKSCETSRETNMKILLINCSPRGQMSESYRLSRQIVGHLMQKDPDSVLTTRSLDRYSMPHADENYAIAQHSADAMVAEGGSVALSDELIHELEEADVLVIGTPMHNLCVPSALKAWIDHVVRARHTFKLTREGKVGALHDRPVYVAISSGGRFSSPNAHQPDFLKPYLKAVLGVIGLKDVTFFSVEGTAAGPDAIAGERSRAAQALSEHFLTP